MEEPSGDDYVPADDLAAELGITRRHLNRVASQREIEGKKRPGDRRTWYPRAPFERALAATDRAIAAALGIPYARVQQIRAQAGRQPAPSHASEPE
jgi:hypothetical protein